MTETRSKPASKSSTAALKPLQRAWRDFRGSPSFVYSLGTLFVLLCIFWFWLMTNSDETLVASQSEWKSVIPPIESLGPEFPQGRKFKKMQRSEGGMQLTRVPPQYGKLQSVELIPHDSNAFTQGLAFYKDRQFETTGLYGKSQLRELDIKTGAVIRSINLPSNVFGEGLSIVDDILYVLTWQNNVVLQYDMDTFQKIKSTPQHTEGWGLTFDPVTDQLVLSDGSDQQYWLDKTDTSVKRQITVQQYDGREFVPVNNLNELEYVHPHIFAHRWFDDNVYVIHADSGQVTQVQDGSLLWPKHLARHNEMSFNGIAVRPVTDKHKHTILDANQQHLHLYVTGKLWPVMHKVIITINNEE